MVRTVLHMDLDAFFASCEERENPKLKGKPLVIGGNPTGRGVVSTCNYEARKFGIHSGMAISKAYMLCPQANFVKHNFALYKEVSNNVMNILRDHASNFQQVGSDEAYLEVKGNVKKAVNSIRKQIWEQERITCSIGIASNKLLAKIASDHNKPNGVTVVKRDKERENS